MTLGLSIQGVKLQDVELPNAEVRAAFTAVTDARETKNTKINEAKNMKTRKKMKRLVKEMQLNPVQLVRRLLVSNKHKEMSHSLIIFMKNIKTNKEITRQRLILETLEQVLPKAKIYIMNDTGETVKYLPLTTIGKLRTPPPADKTQKEAENNVKR